MRATAHDRLVLVRQFNASIDRVFAAWAETAALERWCYPGTEAWVNQLEENDFRVGGRKLARFGPAGDELYIEESRYLDIVPQHRIIVSETILQGERRISTSQITIELVEEGTSTSMKVTDQIALLDGQDSGEARRTGWGEVLERFDVEVSGAPPR